MKWPRNETQLKIRVVFKCGYTHDFWVKDLSITPEKHLEWEHTEEENQMLEFKPDEISSIIRINSRTKIIWE
jgi:hypothetical protein